MTSRHPQKGPHPHTHPPRRSRSPVTRGLMPTTPTCSLATPIDRARLIDAFESWLREFPWVHWVTLTTRQRLSPDLLKHHFIDTFVRRVARAAQGPIRFFLVIEGGALGDHAHIHALLLGTQRVALAAITKKWSWGRAEVAVFDERLGAIHYMLKDIDGPVLDWDFSLPYRPRA